MFSSNTILKFYRNSSLHRIVLYEPTHFSKNTPEQAGMQYFYRKQLPANFYKIQILSGRQNEKRQSEFNLAITLLSIVFMHILCNALRVFLG